MTPGLSLTALTVSRVGSSAAKMVYAGSLPFLIVEWQMTGAEAGAIQSLINLAYAMSLLVASWLADKVGAKNVFLWSVWSCVAAFIALFTFVKDPASASLLFPLVALTLGGSYTPALMLVAQSVEPSRRGSAVGWVLAGSSAGYFLAIALMAWLIPLYGLQVAWAVALLGPLVGAAGGAWAVIRVPPRRDGPRPSSGPQGFVSVLRARKSVLLTTGYTAHCWELLGMWAWAPAFLTFSLLQTTDFSPFTVGLIAAASIHISGAISTLFSGIASDRWGRRRLLLLMGIAGTVLSLWVGWLGGASPIILIAVAALYGFATIGDSGVLSTAMTESVPPDFLGSMLALRSILGFGAGAIAPVAFGLVYDLTTASAGQPIWGWAFCTLGIGGLIATACAAALPNDDINKIKTTRTEA